MINIRSVMYIIACLIFLTACSDNQPATAKVDPFSFTDQHEEPFGTEELSGKVWVASFIFTNCETVCPPMMFEMAALQKLFAKKNIDAEFVSFTVDPEVDSPDILQEYIKHFTKDETNWHMLTGYSQEEIEEFAIEQFQTIVQKPDSSNQVIHGTNFYLVDEQGYVINEYNYVDESYIDDILNDLN